TELAYGVPELSARRRSRLGSDSRSGIDLPIAASTPTGIRNERSTPPHRPRPDDGEDGLVVHLPSPRNSAQHALPALLEGVIVPFGLFYLVLLTWGFRGALITGLTWSLLALARRLWRGERPPATLVMGTVLLTVRTVISFITG